MHFASLFRRRPRIESMDRDPSNGSASMQGSHSNPGQQPALIPGNIVAFPTKTELPRGESASPEFDIRPHSDVPKPKSLLESPELAGFLGRNHFGYGRHNGAVHRTMEARDSGIAERVSEFQNLLLVQRDIKCRQADRIQRELLAVEGVSPITTAQIRLTIAHLHRDISILEEQERLSSNGDGWIKVALDKYRNGFTTGLREALDFDSLTV